MKKNFALVMMAVMALGLAACKEKKTTTETSESSTINGTTTETNTTTETTVDEHGNRTQEVDSKTTVDPQGLMNKETTEEVHTEEKHP